MRNTNWIAFFKLALVGFGIILLINCRKEEIPSNEVNDTTKTELSSSNPADSSLWDTLSYDMALGIFNDMKANASGAWWQEFIENHGVIDWHLAMLSYSEGQDRYIASIPTQKDDTFSGLFLVRVDGGEYDYKFVSTEDFNVSTDQFFAEHTEPYGAMAIVNGAMFNRILESNPACSIEDHLSDSTFISLMESIELRGWCLIEIILWETELSDEPPPKPGGGRFKVFQNQVYRFNPNVPGGMEVIRTGNTLTPEEQASNDAWEIYDKYVREKRKADIQGKGVSDGYAVYQLWAWCDDDFDQNPWDYDWTTNTNEGGGGGGTNTGSNWDYNSKRWYEEDNDCSGYFSGSNEISDLKELEEELIKQACGHAAAYMIKHNIDQIMKEKCEDQLNTGGLPFPGNQINASAMVVLILSELNNHPYVILGRQICEVCDDKATPFLVQQCYNEFLECSSAPSYEECVEGKICEKKYEKALQNNTPTPSDCEELLANLKHEYLKSTYTDYNALNLDIDQFIEDYGSEFYLSTAEMYEVMMTELGGSKPTDPYQWQLMMETFIVELGPTLGEFIPGIGDFIAAYNSFSSGDYFWGCVSLVGVLVPGDELVRAWRNAKTIKKGWNAVRKVFTLWNKLMKSPGGTKILNKMPASWKNIPGSKLADNEKGLKWQLTPQDQIRVMEGAPANHIMNKRAPYVVMQNSSGILGVNNKILTKDHGKFFEDGIEITLNQYEELSHVPLSQITDAQLSNFFN